MAKPLKFHQTLNQAPRSVKHGKHRRAGPPAHGHTVIGTDYSAGGSDAGDTFVTRFAVYEPKPPAVPYAGIRTGEIIGHRLWFVIGERLCSIAHRHLWQPGETIQGDLEEAVWYSAFIDKTIWGGVYAFSKQELLADEVAGTLENLAKYAAWKAQWDGSPIVGWFSSWMPYQETETFVSGTVKMWGDVIEHETGYRSQFAKVNSIDQCFGKPVDLSALRTTYGVVP